jgi:hypothetical protein
MRLVALVLFALAAAGCAGGSDDTAAPALETTTRSMPSNPESETTPAPNTDTTRPRSYGELMARLPPFDEPASPEVAAWRKATISSFFGRCVSGKGGADKPSFVRANRKVLDDMPRFRGATFVGEHSIAGRDGNGCREGGGPATYYTTYRTYRLPAGTKPAAVFRHYEGELLGWVEAAVSPCEHTYGQGPAYLIVSACNGVLRLSVRARGPVEPPAAAPLPTRPFGAQYPIATDYLATPEPTTEESEPGKTCERVSGMDVPSIIVPPAPGVSAEIRGKKIVVEWTLGTVHGDCPPSELILSYPAVTAHTIHEPVHEVSGVTRMPLVESARSPTKLTAIAVSVDGVESRRVSVLITKKNP